MTQSPADKLAAKKPWRRTPRNKAGYIRKAMWICSIRSLRESKRLSMRDVAQAIGLSVTAIHQIERGGDPRLSTARLLSGFFDVDICELWPEKIKAK